MIKKFLLIPHGSGFLHMCSLTFSWALNERKLISLEIKHVFRSRENLGNSCRFFCVCVFFLVCHFLLSKRCKMWNRNPMYLEVEKLFYSTVAEISWPQTIFNLSHNVLLLFGCALSEQIFRIKLPKQNHKSNMNAVNDNLLQGFPYKCFLIFLSLFLKNHRKETISFETTFYK